MYRLLALDLDGTLLRRDHSVDPRDIAAIRELQAAGVTVTIVTGRLASGAADAARTCSIAGTIGCVEGSHLFEVATQKTVYHHAMADDLATMLQDTIATHALSPFVFDADGIHHEHGGAPYAQYVRTWSPNMRIAEERVAWASALAAVAIGDEDAVAAAHAVIREHATQLFSVSFPVHMCPGKHAVLVRAAGPSKGTALAELCRVAGCTLDEAVAVGDWVNDIPMFEVAGRSFAMGSAPEAVRAKATDTLETEAGAGGGIAEAVRRAFG